MRAAKAATPGEERGSQDTCGSYGGLASRAAGRALLGGLGIAAWAAGARATVRAKTKAVPPTVSRLMWTNMNTSPIIDQFPANPLEAREIIVSADNHPYHQDVVPLDNLPRDGPPPRHFASRIPLTAEVLSLNGPQERGRTDQLKTCLCSPPCLNRLGQASYSAIGSPAQTLTTGPGHSSKCI